MRSIPSLIRSCSKEGINPVREIAGFGAGVVAVLAVLGANACCASTALSSLRDEAAFASSPSGLQSTFAGDD